MIVREAHRWCNG